MTQSCERCGLLHPAGTPCFSLDLPAGGAGGLEPRAVLGGRYAIIRTIHRGGMSIVYLATDRVQGRQVAIKELRLPDGATAAEVAEAEGWFARESYLLSTLRHPLIPQFYSVFREQDRSYIVQEYVESESLEELLSRYRSVDPQVLCGWGVAVCELLSYLHTLPAPVVFRDLKPANILLRQADKRLVVVDFGIARPFVAGQVGTVVGTPGYAPPEQYQGLATPQSDIYALGATLHRLLTGHDPEAHAEAGGGLGIPPAQSLNPSIPPALAAVVARALEPVPTARYASAAQMGAALLEAGRRPASGAYPLRPRPRASRVWFGLVAVCLLLPLAVVGVLRIGPGPSGRVPAVAPADAILSATEAALPSVAPVLSPSPSRSATPNVPPTTVVTTARRWGRCRPVTAPLTDHASKLAVSGKGDIWFAIGRSDAIVRMSTHGRTVLCRLPTPASSIRHWAFNPISVSAGPAGSILFINKDDNSIGIGTADGQLRRISLPIPGYPSDSVTDGAGNLWVAQRSDVSNVSRILRLTPKGQLTVYLPTEDSGPLPQLVADRDGSIWYLQNSPGLLWHLNPSGIITPVTTPDTILYIVEDPRGGLWYLSVSGIVGHVGVNGTDVRYPVPKVMDGDMAGGIGVDRSGSVWFSEDWFVREFHATLVRMTRDGHFVSFPLPRGTSVDAPVQGADGAMWFATTIRGLGLGRMTAEGHFRFFPL